jgi:hypothetical protein
LAPEPSGDGAAAGALSAVDVGSTAGLDIGYSTGSLRF